jgi:hypothetical protein
MRFPDVLVELNKIHERLRALEFDVKSLKQDMIKVLPQSALYFSDVDRPKWTDPDPEVTDRATNEKARKARPAAGPEASAEPAVGVD